MLATRPGPTILDKPIYTIGVAAELLNVHPRTLMMYEQLRLIVPQRTSTNRRRYSQRDLLSLQAVQALTRQHGVNLKGARYLIDCLQLLDEHRIDRPPHLQGLDLALVRFAPSDPGAPQRSLEQPEAGAG